MAPKIKLVNIGDNIVLVDLCGVLCVIALCANILNNRNIFLVGVYYCRKCLLPLS